MRLLSCAVLLLLAACGGAGPGVPQVESGWVRLPPPGQGTTAGYLELVNASDQAVTLLGAASPDFGAVEIHETLVEDGQMRMRRLGELTIPAGGRLSLAPGGKHLMLFRPAAPLVEHQEVSLSLALRTADGRTLGLDSRLHVQTGAGGHAH